ncbi:MAG: LemA family protein [Parcubacteria group bacterium]|nr:LemA family protein [Parcubacteria group bacterium]
MNTTLLVVVGVLAVVFLWVVLSYNRLITLRNRTREASSDIEVQLKRRYDLIPNLMQTVKGYASHEQGVFEKVTAARAQAMGAHGMHQKAQAENMLSETLKSLFAVAESYPDLKASTNFLELQRELRDTEDKIQASRRFYNTNVMALNTSLESFPVNLLASSLGFKKEEFFDIDEKAYQEPPAVAF